MKKLNKEQIKVTAIADGSFDREKQKETIITAVTIQGKFYIENIEKTKVKIDGKNSTDKIIKLHEEKNPINQSNLLISRGNTVAGLNIIDVSKIYRETKKPFIIVLSEKPSEIEIKKAIKNTDYSKDKLEIIDKNPKYKKHRNIDLHYINTGIDEREAEKIIERLIHKGKQLEPLRIAKKIAKSITEVD